MQVNWRTIRLISIFLMLAGQAYSTPESSASLPQPNLVAGDSWVFDDAHQVGASGYSQSRVDVVIERVGSDMMVVGGKIDGSPANYTDSIVGLDWSKRVTIDGNQVTTTRPLTFPLTVGDSWSSDYSTPSPTGPQTGAHFHANYKVIGWEDVSVPAGTFHALKIEERGTGEAVQQLPAVAVSALASNNSGTSGLTQVQRSTVRKIQVTTYTETYYVPEIKYWVKNIQEQYNTNNVLLRRDTQSLVSFKSAKQ